MDTLTDGTRILQATTECGGGVQLGRFAPPASSATNRHWWGAFVARDLGLLDHVWADPPRRVDQVLPPISVERAADGTSLSRLLGYGVVHPYFEQVPAEGAPSRLECRRETDQGVATRGLPYGEGHLVSTRGVRTAHRARHPNPARMSAGTLVDPSTRTTL